MVFHHRPEIKEKYTGAVSWGGKGKKKKFIEIEHRCGIYVIKSRGLGGFTLKQKDAVGKQPQDGQHRTKPIWGSETMPAERPQKGKD